MIHRGVDQGSAVFAHEAVEPLPGQLGRDLCVRREPVDAALTHTELAELLAVAPDREHHVGVEHDLARRDAHVDVVTGHRDRAFRYAGRPWCWSIMSAMTARMNSSASVVHPPGIPP